MPRTKISGDANASPESNEEIDRFSKLLEGVDLGEGEHN